jgi:hypothetical protein
LTDPRLAGDRGQPFLGNRRLFEDVFAEHRLDHLLRAHQTREQLRQGRCIHPPRRRFHGTYPRGDLLDVIAAIERHDGPDPAAFGQLAEGTRVSAAQRRARRAAGTSATGQVAAWP